MTAAVLVQEPLFAVAGAHMVTVDAHSRSYPVEIAPREVMQRLVNWFTWSCSCSASSGPEGRWSHPEMAERMGLHHARGAV